MTASFQKGRDPIRTAPTPSPIAIATRRPFLVATTGSLLRHPMLPAVRRRTDRIARTRRTREVHELLDAAGPRAPKELASPAACLEHWASAGFGACVQGGSMNSFSGRAAALAALLAGSSLAAQDPPARYFPLDEGNNWHYLGVGVLVSGAKVNLEVVSRD